MRVTTGLCIKYTIKPIVCNALIEVVPNPIPNTYIMSDNFHENSDCKRNLAFQNSSHAYISTHK